MEQVFGNISRMFSQSHDYQQVGNTSSLNTDKSTDKVDVKEGIKSFCGQYGITKSNVEKFENKAQNLQDVKDTAQKSYNDAKKYGVDVAKRDFVVKLISLAAATLSLALIVGVIVASGGVVGLGLGLVVLCASLSAGVAAGDALFAGYHLHEKIHGRDGPKKEGDSIANAIHYLGEKFGIDAEKLKTLASWGSKILRVFIVLGAFGAGILSGALPAAAALDSFKSANNYISAALSAASGLLGLSTDRFRDDLTAAKHKNALDIRDYKHDLRSLKKAITKALNDLNPGDGATPKPDVDKMVNELMEKLGFAEDRQFNLNSKQQKAVTPETSPKGSINAVNTFNTGPMQTV